MWKLDRLGRSLSHLLSIVNALKEHGVAFRSLTEGMDTTTASGELLFHVFGVLAQYERALTRERVVAGLAAARRRGRVGGRPPAITGEQLDAIRAALNAGMSKAAVCRNFGVKRTTLIHEGLNVVEQWNGATDFVFFARRGEMLSNRREDHEISMLALHLIQNCMVYINTLMIQKVLAQPQWQGKLTPRDYAALTPLMWEHVNPYGRFDLDMNARLALL